MPKPRITLQKIVLGEYRHKLWSRQDPTQSLVKEYIHPLYKKNSQNHLENEELSFKTDKEFKPHTPEKIYV